MYVILYAYRVYRAALYVLTFIQHGGG